MNVAELFRRLSFGELKNLSMSGEGSGDIVEAQRPTIILYTNEALKRIYSRFLLKEENLIIQQQEGRMRYQLHPKFAVSAEEVSGICEPYIIDRADKPFKGDIIKILTVFDHCGVELPLNDEGKANSVFTPTPLVLQVPEPKECESLGIVYQAHHLEVPDDDLEFDVDVPLILEGALTAFIAWMVYKNMNTQEAKVAAQEHLNTYEGICIDVEGRNLIGIGSTTTDHKFNRNGWI